MKAKKWVTIITFICAVISLVFALIATFKCIDLVYDISMAIFGSALLGFIMSLANEWNYEKNNSLTPMDITPNSGKKVWWKCKKGHEWQATVANRNRGSGCPVCRKNKTL